MYIIMVCSADNPCLYIIIRNECIIEAPDEQLSPFTFILFTLMQILMNVLTTLTIVLKHVQTLKEVSLVDVTMAFI